MAQNEIYKVTLEFTDTASAKQYSCGLYVNQATVAGFDVEDIAAEVRTAWTAGLGGGAPLADYYDDTTTLSEITLRKWDPLEATIASSTNGLPLAGAVASESVPPASATLVSLRTANIGRRYRGRIYLPAMAESILDQGTLSAVEAENLAETIVGLFQAWQSIGLGGAARADAVVYSKLLGAGTLITQVKVDRRQRSQRRREVTPADYVSENV